MPVDPNEFWDRLKARGYSFYSGVPDSTFGLAYASLIDDETVRYVAAPREDIALGVVSAAHLAGKKGAVIMQNSGIGNVVNALSSFNLIYEIPALLIIGWRGYGGPPNDAPEHWVMGTASPLLLDALGVPHVTLDPNSIATSIDAICDVIAQTSKPGALLVKPGTFE